MDFLDGQELDNYFVLCLSFFFFFFMFMFILFMHAFFSVLMLLLDN